MFYICYLAVVAMVSLRTGALVCAVAVLTGASVHTGSGITLVDVMLAIVAGEALRAQTGEAVDAIHAGATIKTRAVRQTKMVRHQFRFGQLINNDTILVKFVIYNGLCCCLSCTVICSP